MILQKKQIVHSSIADTQCHLSTIGCFQLIQDAITKMMGLNHIDGVTVKQKYNAFWVFTKTRAKFLKEITWGEEISITCYISNISKIRMNIDVEIKDANDGIAIHSRTELCALDIQTQRLIKLSTIGVSEDMLENKSNEEILFTKFDSIEMTAIENVKVRSTNIDFSHHTNNVEYIRFIMNSYSVKELKTKAMKEMEIIYVHQSYENDILTIKKASLNDKDIFVIEKDDHPVVKCEIVF